MKKTIIYILVLAVAVWAFMYFSDNANNVPSGDDSKTYTQKESRTIAQNWIETESPTYTFDGEDLEIEETRSLDLVECEDCYEFDFTFKSRHGGYGDREGQMVTQAITPHMITVVVEHGEVTQAFTDNEFNEMTGEIFEEGERGEALNPQEVELFYYNREADLDPEGMPKCNVSSVQPIERIIETENKIEDTVALLLEGEIKQGEKDEGFQTEFPNTDFELIDTNLENGVLTLEFTEVPGFTSGGSCRVGLLSAQIEKTAMQFSEVDEVVIKPETLFQP